MNKNALAILLASCMTMSLCSCGKELKPEEVEDPPAMEHTTRPDQDVLVDENGNPMMIEDDEIETERDPSGGPVVISREFEIEGGRVHSLPFRVSKLLKDDWVLAADADKELGPNAVTTVTKFERDGKTLITKVENTTNEVLPIEQCQICSVAMETEFDASVSFEGFTYGSSFKEMKKVFGENEMDDEGDVIYLISANKQMKAHFTDDECDSFSLVWMKD